MPPVWELSTGNKKYEDIQQSEQLSMDVVL